ncbi:MAG: shikimate kinase [Bacteroidales bacterium]|nr:shikimate kinase [Bacteroidales bacterium]
MTISLTGFMGSGKSSVGKELASILGCPLLDLDAFIEDKFGESVPDIFSRGGEKLFRELESAALKEVLSSSDEEPLSRTILSLGGGTPTIEDNAALIKEKTVCFYLKAGIDTLVSNLENDSEGRPMLRGTDLRQRIISLMSEREDSYRGCASHVIDIDGKPFKEVAEEIASLLI